MTVFQLPARALANEAERGNLPLLGEGRPSPFVVLVFAVDPAVLDAHERKTTPLFPDVKPSGRHSRRPVDQL